MELSGEVTIEASADRVWEIIGRLCVTGLRAFPAVGETIVAYDETSRTLS